MGNLDQQFQINGQLFISIGAFLLWRVKFVLIISILIICFLMVFLFVSISRVPKDRQFLVLRFNYCCSYAHLNFTWYLRNTNSNYDVFVLFFSFLVFMAFAGSFSPVSVNTVHFYAASFQFHFL